MPSFCAVVACNDRYGHSESVSFHKFPLKRPNLLRQWEAFIQQQRGSEWRASRWSSLCSRHFREDDFRSLNERKTLKKSAVPSVFGNVVEQRGKKTITIGRNEDVGDKEFTEILAIKERLEDVGNVVKTNCRLCGVTCVPAVMFSSNIELYGMLQKCFPTLNIQEEDDLPKALCATCNRNLEHFGEFVDRVWTAQADLQRKYKSRAVEKSFKIKQEPLVRVKQEVAEFSNEQNQREMFGIGNEDYDAMGDVTHDDAEDSGTVDHKYELCDFPIINDCDIMEIINLDDPFINIPDDDNTDPKELKRSVQGEENYLPSAHELLQEHMLMEEHNYAYVDSEVFKDERRVYKTEKTEIDERKQEDPSDPSLDTDIRKTSGSCGSSNNASQSALEASENICNTQNSEKRALKPIVTSVSAIQQPNKGNSIIVLNESIVQSGGGFQLHECMVCQLKFFSIGNLKEHYTQTHGTPMVSVPSGNIATDKPTHKPCKTENEFGDTPKTSENLNKEDLLQGVSPISYESPMATMDCCVNKTELEQSKNLDVQLSTKPKVGVRDLQIFKRRTNTKIRMAMQKERHISLNIMASQYQQLKKLYQRLQKKCSNLEQNVEHLQHYPLAMFTKKSNISKMSATPRRKTRITRETDTKAINQEDDKCPLPYTCPECPKSFSNSNSFRQHKITHTQDKKHVCGLCQRSFKRRNGLQQHLKGFHLQVKPFMCPVCKHNYALKCDMLRCRHSALKSNKCFDKTKT